MLPTDEGLLAKILWIFLVGKTLTTNPCFAEYIILFLPIMTYCNSFSNSIQHPTAL